MEHESRCLTWHPHSQFSRCWMIEWASEWHAFSLKLLCIHRQSVQLKEAIILPTTFNPSFFVFDELNGFPASHYSLTRYQGHDNSCSNANSDRRHQSPSSAVCCIFSVMTIPLSSWRRRAKANHFCCTETVREISSNCSWNNSFFAKSGMIQKDLSLAQQLSVTINCSI